MILRVRRQRMIENRIEIIAADSLGVRSLATYADLCGHKIFLDPGASLAPRRYGLPPHVIEKERLQKVLGIIEERLQKSDIVIISHYHYDHYLKNFPELFRGKTLLVKNPRKDINKSQRIRAWKFLNKSGLWGKSKIFIADRNSYMIDEDLKIEFSDPVWHGDIGTKVGKVIMTRILCRGQSIIFTSDVQGPADPLALNTLRSWNKPRPSVMILCGPPTYFSGFKVPEKAVVKGLEGVRIIIEKIRPRILILDHHLIRDPNYPNYINRFRSLASSFNVNVLTGAEFMNKKPEPLEAWRKKLWKKID